MTTKIDVSTNQLCELTSNNMGNKATLDEILLVWHNIGKIIISQLEIKKGVKLSSLGTFTLSNKLIPIFNISNDFSNEYQLKQKGQISQTENFPIVMLNYSTLGQLCNIERDKTEKIYNKFLFTLGRCLSEGRNVLLTIHKVAEIDISGNDLECKFVNDFISQYPSIFSKVQTTGNVLKRNNLKIVAQKTLQTIKIEKNQLLNTPRSNNSNSIGNGRASTPTNNIRRNSASGMSGSVLNKQSLERLNQSNQTQNGREIAAKAIYNNNNSAEDIINKVRTKIIERGGSNGIRTLTRLLMIMDDNGDKKISKDELKYGLRDYGITLTDTELEYIFICFDTDHNGFIDVTEFLVGIRGPLNQKRRNLIKQVFNILDIDQSGEITTDEILKRYDMSWNPEVREGKKTIQQAAKEFMSQWNRTIQDDVVTYDEFETYYKDVSASIDDDTYFELMMRNAWRIAGGEGQAANTANKRVLVTNKDGSQSVQTINNELGMKSKDMNDIRSRLQQQGVNSTNIDLYGYSDNTNKAKNPSKQPNFNNNRPNSAVRSNNINPITGLPSNVSNSNNNGRPVAPTNGRRQQPQSQQQPMIMEAWGGDQNIPTEQFNRPQSQVQQPRRSSSANPTSRNNAIINSNININVNANLKAKSNNQLNSNNNSLNSFNPMEILRQLLYDPPIALEQLCNKLQVSLTSNNPRITMNAFKTCLNNLNKSLTKENLNNIWLTIDTNNVGSIEIVQLHNYLSNSFGKDKNTLKNTSNNSVIERIKTKILDRCGGQAGIKGLTRVLSIMDNNGDKKLSKDELK